MSSLNPDDLKNLECLVFYIDRDFDLKRDKAEVKSLERDLQRVKTVCQNAILVVDSLAQGQERSSVVNWTIDLGLEFIDNSEPDEDEEDNDDEDGETGFFKNQTGSKLVDSLHTLMWSNMVKNDAGN